MRCLLMRLLGANYNIQTTKQVGIHKIKADGLLSNLGVEYNAHWTGLIKTSVQWKSWWKMLGESPGVLHKPQTNPVGFTTQADGYTITQCQLGI